MLREFISDLLIKRWSPEQISHELSVAFPGERARPVVPETIYQASSRSSTGSALTRAAVARATRRFHPRLSPSHHPLIPATVRPTARVATVLMTELGSSGATVQ